MPTTLAPPEDEVKQKNHAGSMGGGHFFGDNNWGGGDSDRWGHYGPHDYGSSSRSNRLAMWLCMASITMLFAGLSSAYVFRLGVSSNEPPIPLPTSLMSNTLVLLASSFTLEVSRRRQKDNRKAAFRRWLSLTAILGLTFLLVQLHVWRQLVAHGVYLSSTPHASFFYLLTGAHGVHLCGGILALGYSLYQAGFGGNATYSGRGALDVTAMYWHFMSGLWVYLFLLLFFWRY